MFDLQITEEKEEFTNSHSINSIPNIKSIKLSLFFVQDQTKKSYFCCFLVTFCPGKKAEKLKKLKSRSSLLTAAFCSGSSLRGNVEGKKIKAHCDLTSFSKQLFRISVAQVSSLYLLQFQQSIDRYLVFLLNFLAFSSLLALLLDSL